MSGDKPKDLLSEIDVRLNGVLGELGRALGDAITKLEDGGGEVRHSQSFQTSKGPMRAEAGIRVRMGGLDLGTQNEVEPEPAPVNTPQPNEPGAKPSDDTAPRDIAATIITSDHSWSLTAELPGASPERLTVGIEDDALMVEALGPGRHYKGRFELPPGLSEEDLSVTLKNGILDITATGSWEGDT